MAEPLGMRNVQPVSDEDITLSVDVSPVWERELAAMWCHATQWTSSPMALAGPERQRTFFGVEYFVCAGVRRRDGDFMERLLKEGRE